MSRDDIWTGGFFMKMSIRTTLWLYTNPTSFNPALFRLRFTKERRISLRITAFQSIDPLPG